MASSTSNPAPRVVVFGRGGEGCGPDSELYATARTLGHGLAAAGFELVTGGYGGTMEAVALGAQESQRRQGKSVGMIATSLFPKRPPIEAPSTNKGNKYNSQEVDCASLCERFQRLTEDETVVAFVALPGSLGTFTELMVVLNQNYIAPCADKPIVPVYAFATPWKPLWEACKASLHQSDEVAGIHFVESADDVFQALRPLSLDAAGTQDA